MPVDREKVIIGFDVILISPDHINDFAILSGLIYVSDLCIFLSEIEKLEMCCYISIIAIRLCI